MVKYLLFLGMIILLVECGNTFYKSITQPKVQAEEPFVQDPLETESKHLTSLSPQYLDESKYTGDELEIVRLINQRAQFLREGNEEEYLTLFTEDRPVSQIPNYQIQELVIEDKIAVQEQKQIYQAACRIREIHIDKAESSRGYVFKKDKQDAQAAWKIADID
ncbi:hypothetical protein PV403_01965 [Paenibacillus sp. GYB006]|uniref:hypothetical protein n=1 Tax=Paenibacillus sp. GYB006 TaxID=2994394 RepID=UPI002F967CD4